MKPKEKLVAFVIEPIYEIGYNDGRGKPEKQRLANSRL